MVEARPTGILKNADEGLEQRHVQFDEEEIAAYDAQRGQCQQINDPKTPFHEENSDDEMNAQEDVDNEPVDPELVAHLEEAKQNQQANAQITSGVRRAQQPGAGAAATQGPTGGLGGIDPSALMAKLEQVGDGDGGLAEEDEEAKAAASKQINCL